MPVTSSDDPQILAREDGASIAYHRLRGRTPGVVFMTGFMSDMSGGKALALEAFCRRRGQAFLRFDYQGHGCSSGEFADGHIGIWTDDAIAAVDQLSEGPQVLVGSSMGGWIMLLTALSRTDRVAGLIGIAAAPDFTEDVLPKELTAEQMAAIESEGKIVMPSQYEDDYIITKTLIEEGRKHLLMHRPIPLDCPVRLIHGMGDQSVPWQTALELQERLASADVEVTLVKSGDHRLSADGDMTRMLRTLDALLDQLS